MQNTHACARWSLSSLCAASYVGDLPRSGSEQHLAIPELDLTASAPQVYRKILVVRVTVFCGVMRR